ncbi:hypothetical protein GCK32_013129 [Trichostrongylus colubriformis]|uniref:Secreted protein n=1 Tax=Trichostrongylus colubriformis TaxID=6319 RepID=A0AAN8FKQ1_TRICO
MSEFFNVILVTYVLSDISLAELFFQVVKPSITTSAYWSVGARYPRKCLTLRVETVVCSNQRCASHEESLIITNAVNRRMTGSDGYDKTVHKYDTNEP